MAEGTLGGTPISELPASSFAYCEPGDGAVSVRCHFPIRDKNGKPDAAHVRNALARLGQSAFERQARPKVEAAAKELGIGEGKAFAELKAEPMSTSRLDRWLKGEISRRVLVLPFGGPIPAKGAPLGVDLDGEWFDRDTDIYGSYAVLRETRERLVDWHHDNDPTGRMKGAILGRVVLDDEPEDDGVWADMWANAGEQRRKLVADLERRGVALYGSSEAVPGAVRKTDGHIDVWPLIRHTFTTSPQNTRAVVPSLKAVLTEYPLDEIGTNALKAAVLGLDAETIELLLGSRDAAVTASALVGQGSGKAGRVLSAQTIADLERVIDLAERELPALIRAIVARGRPTELENPS